jgi:hypothetical protein
VVTRGPPSYLNGLEIAVGYCMLLVCPVTLLNNYEIGVEGFLS